MTGIAVKDGGVVVDGDGICLGCCLYAGVGNDCCCFLEPGTAGHCDNADWDSAPPYGGPGRTPKYYTVTYTITWRDSATTTTFFCDTLGPIEGGSAIIQCPYQNTIENHVCRWWDGDSVYGTSPEDSDGNKVGLQLRLDSEGTATTRLHISANPKWDECCFSNDMDVGDTRYYMYDPNLGECVIAGSKVAAHEDSGTCIFKKTDIGPLFFEAGDMVVSWYPGKVPEWDECTDYEIGDMVAHEGVFYCCIRDHAAGSPPSCTGAYEPGVDTDWELYWEEC